MELAFFNHASLAVVDKERKFGFITDPWIASPAFGAWQPHPKLNEPEFIAYLDTLENYALVISHGHDDHCDDSYIKARLRPSQIFIPKYSSQGFYKRIQRLSKEEAAIVELDHGKPHQFGQFWLMATINPDYTSNDAIVAIRDDANTVIHANDNWHKQPDDVLTLLRDFSSQSEVTYLSQIGIAGSFPLYYLGMDSQEKTSFIVDQIRLQAECIEANSRSLGAVRAYSYANESMFSFLDSTKSYSGAFRESILGDYISQDTIYQGELANANDFEQEGLSFYNLRQHCSFMDVSKEHRGTPPLQLPTDDITDKLTKLTNQINNYLNESTIAGMVTLSAMTRQHLESLYDFGDISTNDQEVPVLHLYSTHEIWHEILSGELNLESITIGGCGLLKKSPTSWNARDVHDALSRFGYRYQSMITQKQDQP